MLHFQPAAGHNRRDHHAQSGCRKLRCTEGGQSRMVWTYQHQHCVPLGQTKMLKQLRM
jgi:hypothetical protein